MTNDNSQNSADLLAMTADIVSAHVAANSVSATDLPTLIKSVHGALAGLGTPIEEPAAKQEPAVSVRASIKPEYIVCLEDGKKLKMLKRHLMTHYQMTPDQYRAKWSLPSDYPMVAPAYAAIRKELALKIGLGRKAKVAEPVKAIAAKVTKSVVDGLEAARQHLSGDAPAKPVRKPRTAKLAPSES